MPIGDIATGVILFAIFALVMAVSFRLALKPAIEAMEPAVQALKDLREEFAGRRDPEAPSAQVRELRSEVERLRTKVDRLEEAREFDRELRGGPEDGA